jgi:hypothetical protein
MLTIENNQIPTGRNSHAVKKKTGRNWRCELEMKRRKKDYGVIGLAFGRSFGIKVNETIRQATFNKETELLSLCCLDRNDCPKHPVT